MNHHGRQFSVTVAVAMAFLASTHAPTQGDGTYAGGHQYIEQPAQIASVEQEEQQTPTAAQDRVHPDVRAKPRSRGYVAITLKPEIQKDATPQQQKAAIKKAQDQMLARMAAEEFKLVYRFKSAAMLVGHLKAAGSAKLNEDPIVVSVAPSKIRADVFAKLQESDDGTVQVIVNLTRVTQGAPISDQRKAAVKQIQDRVLSTLTAQEFKAPVRFNQMVSHLAGYANSAGLAKLQAHPDVWAVALPGISKPTTGSSIPFINADLVHALGYTGLGVTVAVIDTGIDYGEPGLQDGIALGGTSFEGGIEYADGGADLYGFGHGTYMSLIITDPTGVAPNSKILPINVFGPGGGASDPDIILGIEYVILRRNADPSIRVINLSLGGLEYFPCVCDAYPGEALLAEAISLAAGAGIITFAATGNEAVCGGISSPGCASDAVPVTASYDGYYSTT